MSEVTIKRRLYLFAGDDLPQKLLAAMVKNISNFDDKYKDEHGRVGLMGVQAERLGLAVQDMFYRRKNLETGTTYFKQLVSQIRREFPEIDLAEWYLLALACYYTDDRPLEAFRRLPVQRWKVYSARHRYGVEFAERTWRDFKDNNGIIK